MRPSITNLIDRKSMCTLALFFKIIDGYPIVVAANRDERYDRPAAPPALIDANPKIIAGTDLRAGGTWLGANEYGLLVGILNRRANGVTSVKANPRSRGLLCRDLLRLRTSAEAREFLSRHRDQYNPFTLLFVDPQAGGVSFNATGIIATRDLAAGLHVFSSAAVIDTASGKADRAYGRFLAWAAHPPPVGESTWLDGLRTLLADHSTTDNDQPRDAVCVHGAESGTVSSSIVSYSAAAKRFETYYCDGAPCQTCFGSALALDVA
jgi:uncharacterized protein with NRDE domain